MKIHIRDSRKRQSVAPDTTIELEQAMTRAEDWKTEAYTLKDIARRAIYRATELEVIIKTAIKRNPELARTELGQTFAQICNKPTLTDREKKSMLRHYAKEFGWRKPLIDNLEKPPVL